MNKKLPDWLISKICLALLGEIYQNIRAIAVQYDNKDLVIKYYLDRIPEDFDYESIEVVATHLDSMLPTELVHKLDVECVKFEGNISQMPSLNGFVYARREYD